MSQWSATKARRVLAALIRIGWSLKHETGGSHRVLERKGWSDYVWAFHDGVEIGPIMLARISRDAEKGRRHVPPGRAAVAQAGWGTQLRFAALCVLCAVFLALIVRASR